MTWWSGVVGGITSTIQRYTISSHRRFRTWISHDFVVYSRQYVTVSRQTYVVCAYNTNNYQQLKSRKYYGEIPLSTEKYNRYVVSYVLTMWYNDSISSQSCRVIKGHTKNEVTEKKDLWLDCMTKTSSSFQPVTLKLFEIVTRNRRSITKFIFLCPRRYSRSLHKTMYDKIFLWWPHYKAVYGIRIMCSYHLDLIMPLYVCN